MDKYVSLGNSVKCSSCKKTLDKDHFNTSKFYRCPLCSTMEDVRVFPALYKDLSKQTVKEELVIDDEAGCFYHPEKKAATPCSGCGRFLCELCNVEMGNSNYCLSCLEKSQKKNDVNTIEKSRTLYDRMALFMALAPFTLILYFVTIITAPVSLFISIRYWNKPMSILPRTKYRFIIAFIVSLGEIIAMIVFTYFIIKKF